MRKSRLVIPGLICFMMASAIMTHAVLSMPCGLQQHFLVRNLLMNLIGIIALVTVALISRRSVGHLVALWATFGASTVWLPMVTFHWPLAAYFPPVAAAWLVSGCAAVAVENRRRAAWVVFGIWCFAAGLYAVRHAMLEQERSSATCINSAGQTNYGSTNPAQHHYTSSRYRTLVPPPLRQRDRWRRLFRCVLGCKVPGLNTEL